METSIQTRTEVINRFLKENRLNPKDLARYLELHHDFCCYADTHYEE